ncbi:flavodoxin family protein [Rickettsia hoogstraalii]|nr:flavodoxin family protein [Rickettsia hoogstraalii]
MVKVAIVYYSGYGHTAKVAEELHKSVKEAGANVSLIKIN